MADNADGEQHPLLSVAKKLPLKPGVYRFYDSDQQLLYVGKARQLQKRVLSYFTKGAHPTKTLKLVAKTVALEVTITASENDALLLESNLIKAHRPRYNILLKDDKSYPYIFVSTQHDYPSLLLHRGSKKQKGQYFGPYPNGYAARKTIHFLQKLFKIRNCTDSFFKHRHRPCLQYQIKRCSAPCVNYISTQDYAKSVEEAVLFLQGKSTTLIEQMSEKMNRCSEQQNYEQAGVYRDRIIELRHIQTSQAMSKGSDDVDIFFVEIKAKLAVVVVLQVRAGQVLGSRKHFPKVPDEAEPPEILTSFIAQFYLNYQHPVPGEVIVNHLMPEADWLKSALVKAHGRQLKISHAVRGHRREWLTIAKENAQLALAQKLDRKQQLDEQFQALSKWLDLPQTLETIACFDMSHTHGASTVGACVVFDQGGPAKMHYKRFNIKGITPGDDYAAMMQSLKRYFKLVEANKAIAPDLLLIDGGRGQLSSGKQALDELGISGVCLLGVAKGEKRKAGLERFFKVGSSEPIPLPARQTFMSLLLQVRDEAHRFAIEGHRRQLARARKHSLLETIEGVGPKKAQQLLEFHGGWQQLRKADVKSLASVPGISYALAERIYQALQGASE